MLAMSGCVHHPPGHKDLVAFLQDGITTKAEARERIDQVPKEWSGGRIWTFRIGEDSDGLYPFRSAEGWSGVRYSLVLEFDANGVLHRHALVDVTNGG